MVETPQCAQTPSQTEVTTHIFVPLASDGTGWDGNEILSEPKLWATLVKLVF
jgi:hypothetical protein